KPLVDYAKEVQAGLHDIPNDPAISPEDKKVRLAELYALHTALEDTTLPTRNIIPRNLRSGIYRGGRAPYDLYRRIAVGINGTPMPGARAAGPGQTGLQPDEIWNVVDYVRSLPYEPINQPPPATRFTGQGQL
ncbi:MAG TPA: hypothetical protein VGH74_12620, partial [Planctomycetaceae bacterium]